ncbi:MAG: transposase [Mariniphaga sp.]|nr:transposase [Mariniphaga sp.]
MRLELNSPGNDEKTNEGVLHFFSAFRIGRFLSTFNAFKSKGIDVSVLLLSLLIFRLRGESICRMQNRAKNFLESIDDNTFYRLMNNQLMDWRKLLLGLAKQFAAHVRAKGDYLSGTTCFVLDDTDIEKTGKTIEFIGRVFNHVTKLYPLGFKMLLLGFWDGKTLIATDFSLHREKGKKETYGLSKKELKSQFRQKRDSKSPGHKRALELDMKKGEVAVSMLRRAVKNGFIASYVLMDSWFVNDYMIKSIRSIKKGAMHLLGMCKIDRRKYLVGNREMNAHQLIVKNQRKNSKYSRKHKSTYISMVVDYKGEKVRLFFIRYNNAKNWTLLLTTDLTLSFVRAIELYQIRWTIEVLFKECKQYLRLGASQNTNFDGQIADATIVLATHTILSLQKRFSCYETMGELFRETQQHLLELTLWERLVKVFFKMLVLMAEILNTDVEEMMEKLMQSDKTSRQLLAMLKALEEFEDNGHNNNKIGDWLPTA